MGLAGPMSMNTKMGTSGMAPKMNGNISAMGGIGSGIMNGVNVMGMSGGMAISSIGSVEGGGFGTGTSSSSVDKGNDPFASIFK